MGPGGTILILTGLSNPLRYTDPSAYIAEDEVERANRIRSDLAGLGIILIEDYLWEIDPVNGEPVWNPGA